MAVRGYSQATYLARSSRCQPALWTAEATVSFIHAPFLSSVHYFHFGLVAIRSMQM